MSTKFSTQKRPIFPPPVCKKVPPYPPMPDIPPNAIIVQIIGQYEDDVERFYRDCGQFVVYRGDGTTWDSIVEMPMTNYCYAELDFTNDFQKWEFSIQWNCGGDDVTLIGTGLQTRIGGNPFHAPPTSMLDRYWSGYLTVELASA